MFNKIGKREKTALDREIDEAIANLSVISKESDGYEKAVDNLKKLTDIKAELEKPKNPVNPNTIIAGTFTLVTALIMLNYEKTDVITSKVMSLLSKPKI